MPGCHRTQDDENLNAALVRVVAAKTKMGNSIHVSDDTMEEKSSSDTKQVCNNVKRTDQQHNEAPITEAAPASEKDDENEIEIAQANTKGTKSGDTKQVNNVKLTDEQQSEAPITEAAPASEKHGENEKVNAQTNAGDAMSSDTKQVNNAKLTDEQQNGAPITEAAPASEKHDEKEIVNAQSNAGDTRTAKRQKTSPESEKDKTHDSTTKDTNEKNVFSGGVAKISAKADTASLNALLKPCRRVKTKPKPTKIVVLPPIPHSAGPNVRLDPMNPQHFDHFLFQLLAFKSEYNTFVVPKDDYPDLHAWLQLVKRMYKQFGEYAESRKAGNLRKGLPLTVAQIKVLDHLNVPLATRGNGHWNRFYSLLRQYKDRHGHVLVPRFCEVPGLGDWVTDQRRQHKAMEQGQPTLMTNERLEKLARIGFTFQVRNRPEWDTRYAELLEYKEKYGNCRVPQNYKENKALGRWVAKQREQHRRLRRGHHSHLTPYRVEKLETIGFIWSIRSAADDDSDASIVKLPNNAPNSTRTTSIGVADSASVPMSTAAKGTTGNEQAEIAIQREMDDEETKCKPRNIDEALMTLVSEEV